MSAPASPERVAAARILVDQLRGREALLDRALRHASDHLDSTQTRSLWALVLGVTRNRSRLEWQLAPYLPKPLSEQDDPVQAALLLGTFELTMQDGVPERAAVQQAVELMRALNKPRKVRFVNAVLRSVLRGERRELPDRLTEPLRWAEIACSHPRWILEAMPGEPQEVADQAELNNAAAPIFLRAREPGDDLTDLGARPVDTVPGAWRLDGPLDGEALEAGRIWVQDAAAQAVDTVLDPQPGERIIDVCAAPGGKSFAAAVGVGPEGRVVAWDASKGRLKRMREARQRLGFSQVQIVQRDLLERPWAEDDEAADCVLVDAPCSGFGVLRRHPDIRWNRRPEDLPRYAERQAALLEACAPAVRPGGRLVYAVCTVTPAETDDVVDAFLAAHPEFTEEQPDLDPSLLDGMRMRTHAGQHGFDGFFAVRLRKAGVTD